MQGGLRIVVSTHLEHLLDGLAEALRRDRDRGLVDAFAAEWVVVPSQGLRRWVELGLADRFGIVGGLEMPFLTGFVEDLATAILPSSPTSPPTAFDPAELHWRIFGALRAAASGEGPATFEPLRHYLDGDADRQLRRGQLATRIADRFAEYRAFRPDLLAAWENGRPAGDEETRRRLGPHEPWQRALWRSLTDRSDGPGTRHQHLLEILTGSAPGTLELPSPLHVFGFGTLPPPAVELLHAAARHAAVQLWIVSPSSEFWSDVRKGSSDEDDVGNQLLATLGRPARDTFDALIRLEERADPDAPVDVDLPDLHRRLDADELENGASLLAAVQHDIRQVIVRGTGHPAEDRRLDAEAFADDDSIEIHCCHGPLRELEVLRDRLLDAFHRNPELRPDDVVVLVPSIETWAPYIDAAFGAVRRQDTDEPLLSYAIADRSALGTDPMAAAFGAVLDLVGSRLTQDEVLGLLEHEPVRARFGFAADDVSRCRELTDLAGIRWGESGPRRQSSFDVPPLPTATWAEGRDRLLLGYAVGATAGDELIELPEAPLLPAADATTGRADLLGRLTEFQSTLFAVLQDLERHKPLEDHLVGLHTAVDRLLDAPGDAGREAAAQRLRDALRSAFPATGRPEGDEAERIAFPPVRGFARDAVEAAFSGRAIDFPSGRITVCALRPLRTVPFEVVCVAGLQDGAFPRSDSELPFDLIRADRRPGDRSTRADDRLLFLETLLAARHRLLLSYTGRSARDDSELAPSTCLAELCEQIDRTLQPADHRSAELPHRAFVIHAPLQAFDGRHFDAREPRLHGRSADALAAARVLGHAEPVPPIAAPAPTAPPPVEQGAELTLPLDDLLAFWKHPARHFVRGVLHASLAAADDEDRADTEVITLDFLERHRGREFLARRPDPSDQRGAEQLRQQALLPAGAVGAPAWEQLRDEITAWRDRLPPDFDAATGPIDAVFHHRSGLPIRLVGNLPGQTSFGVVTARPSSLKDDDTLRLWIVHVVSSWLHTRHDPQPLRPAWHLGLDADQHFTALTAEQGEAALQALLDGWLCGQLGPLPYRADDASTALDKGLDAAALGNLRRAWRKAAAATRHDPQQGARPLRAEEQLAFRHADPYDPPEAFCHWVEAIQRPLAAALADSGELPWLTAAREDHR